MYNTTYMKYKINQVAADPKYKSELCNKFILKGNCDYGIKCRFAHGIEDLSQNRRKIIKSHAECESYNILNFCPKGDSCDLTHNGKESFLFEEDDVLSLITSNCKSFSEYNYKRLTIFEKLSDCSSTASNSRRCSVSE